MRNKSKKLGILFSIFGIILLLLGLIRVFPIQYITNNQNVLIIAYEYPSCNNSSSLELHVPYYVYKDYSFTVLVCNTQPNYEYALGINYEKLGFYESFQSNETEIELYINLDYSSLIDGDLLVISVYGENNDEFENVILDTALTILMDIRFLKNNIW